jgi:hypothetical protein
MKWGALESVIWGDRRRRRGESKLGTALGSKVISSNK